MKILFCTDYFPPFTPGGTPWSTLQLTRALVRRGHQVLVVTPNYGAAPRETVDGVEVVRFPYWRKLPPGASLMPLKRHLSPLYHAAFFFHLFRAARAFRPDVFQVEEKHAMPAAYLAARLTGRPVCLTLRDYGLLCPIATCLLKHDAVPADCGFGKLQRECSEDYMRLYPQFVGGKPRWLFKAMLQALFADTRIKQAVLNRLDGVFGISRAFLDIYGAVLKRDGLRRQVVYNLPPADWRSPEKDAETVKREMGLSGRKVALFVGKLSLGKGFWTFWEAAPAIARGAGDVAFLVAGTAQGALPEPAGADVRFLGQVPQSRLVELYAAADVVLMPSLWPEPFGRILVEAGTMGKPCVSTDVGAPREIIDHGVTGLLVRRGDAAALAEAVVSLLNDPARARAMGEAARVRLRDVFSEDKIVGGLEAAYDETVRRR